MVLLKTVTQHRAIDFYEDVGSDLDDVVGTDPEDVGVEGCVMDLAEREAVRHDRIATVVTVSEDVRSVEQLYVSDLTDGAALAVRAQDALAERSLVEAHHGEARDVGASRLVDHGDWEVRSQEVDVLACDGERFGCRVVGDDQRRPQGGVGALTN